MNSSLYVAGWDDAPSNQYWTRCDVTYLCH